jgi:rod shape-determining protein MreC
MIVDHKQGHLKIVRSALSTLVYPVQIMVNLPVEAGRWMMSSFSARRDLLAENERLREEQNLINSKLQRFEVLEAENRRLRELLGSTIDFREKVLIAELLAVDMEPDRHLFEIIKGTREGVYEGQPVVDAKGVVGQVFHVSTFSSTVLLITDPSHAVPVQINRNGLRAIAVGTGQNNSLLLEHLPTNADIEVGDLIVSSGLGKRFPRGYPVGQIAAISHEPGSAFVKVSVNPSAEIEQSREVLLLWPEHGDAHGLNTGEAL